MDCGGTRFFQSVRDACGGAEVVRGGRAETKEIEIGRNLLGRHGRSDLEGNPRASGANMSLREDAIECQDGINQ
jgi:hypothetical protein